MAPSGPRAIEDFQPGDLVLSRCEATPFGLVGPKVVERVYVGTGRIFHLHINGQLIRTTPEHPFYERNKGWTACRELAPGDCLSGADGQWVGVDEVLDTGEYETVHNLCVSEHHTYFVTGNDWDFSVWAHNESYLQKSINNNPKVVVEKGPNKGLIAYKDPKSKTGATAYAPRDEMAGDHVLPRQYFKNAVEAREAALGRSLEPGEIKKVKDLLNGNKNLRPMPSRFNESKGDRLADKWQEVAKNKDSVANEVSPAYFKDVADIQKSVTKDLDNLLGTFKKVPAK